MKKFITCVYLVPIICCECDENKNIPYECRVILRLCEGFKKLVCATSDGAKKPGSEKFLTSSVINEKISFSQCPDHPARSSSLGIHRPSSVPDTPQDR